jgi:hypothetical protein
MQQHHTAALGRPCSKRAAIVQMAGSGISKTSCAVSVETGPRSPLVLRVQLDKSDPSRGSERADDDAPLLALVDDTDPVALLDHALTRLVERVGSLRRYSPKGKR